MVPRPMKSTDGVVRHDSLGISAHITTPWTPRTAGSKKSKQCTPGRTKRLKALVGSLDSPETCFTQQGEKRTGRAPE